MSEKSKLDRILSDLIIANKRQSYLLKHGLRVAYTPPYLNENIYRLCLSRRGSKPSDAEGRTVWAALCEASAVKRPFARLTFGVDGRGCFVIEWADVIQQSLLTDGGGNNYDSAMD